MHSLSIINKSQVANSSIAMVSSIRKIVQLDVAGSGMRRISKTSRDLDFCHKGNRVNAFVRLCKQWFLVHVHSTVFPFSKVFEVEPLLEE